MHTHTHTLTFACSSMLIINQLAMYEALYHIKHNKRHACCELTSQLLFLFSLRWDFLLLMFLFSISSSKIKLKCFHYLHLSYWHDFSMGFGMVLAQLAVDCNKFAFELLWIVMNMGKYSVRWVNDIRFSSSLSLSYTHSIDTSQLNWRNDDDVWSFVG